MDPSCLEALRSVTAVAQTHMSGDLLHLVLSNLREQEEVGGGASGTEGRPGLQLCVGRGISRCLVNTGARDWLRRWENKAVSLTQSWGVATDAQLCLALWLSGDIAWKLLPSTHKCREP